MNMAIESASFKELAKLFEIEKQSYIDQESTKGQIAYLLTEKSCPSLL
jgi:hypothetical protein